MPRKNARRNQSIQKTKRPSGKSTELPLCRFMHPLSGISADAAGVVLIRRLGELRPGRYAISILAHDLPLPSELGPYNDYQGLAFIPGIITWTFSLYATPEVPSTWSGSFTESTLNPSQNGIAQVRLAHSETGAIGPVVLEAVLDP